MNSRCWSVLKYNTTHARTSIPNFSGHIRVHDDGSMKTESSVVVLWCCGVVVHHLCASGNVTTEFALNRGWPVCPCGSPGAEC